MPELLGGYHRLIKSDSLEIIPGSLIRNTEKGPLVMYWLKACPKCHGDLYESRDEYGTFISCMQCSLYLTEADEAKLRLGSWNHQPDRVAPLVVETEKIAA
ncbi:MAG: hypothetical protein ACE5Q6_02840 [Dehalococcoidia bacterium]